MDVKKELKRIIEGKKQQKAMEDTMRAARNEEDRMSILKNVGGDLSESLKPALEQLATAPQITKEHIREAMEGAFQVHMPEMPAIQVPEIKVDTRGLEGAIKNAFANLKIEAPSVSVQTPPMEFPDTFALRDIDEKRPLPVRLYEADGKPFQIVVPASTGGGKSDFLTIKGIMASAFGDLMNADGRLRTENNTASTSITDTVTVNQLSGANWSVYLTGSSGTVGVVTINPDGTPTYASATSGLTDTELRATAVPVSQLSGAIWSTSIIDAFGSTGVTQVWNPDNRLRVSVETGGSGLTDAELRASHLDVVQMSGAVSSVNILQTAGSATVVGTGYQDNALRVVNATDAITSVNVVSSATLTVTGTLTSTGAYLLNGDGTYRDTVPVSGTVVVSSVTNSVAASLVDSSGVQYSGSNPLPITGTIAAGTEYTEGATDASITGTAALAEAASDLVQPLRLGAGNSEQALRVVHASDAIASVYLATALASEIDSITTVQLSGAINSVNLLQTAGNATVVGTGYQDNALRVVNATDAITSVNVVSSATLTVTGTLTSTGAYLLNGDGTYRDTMPISGAVTLSGALTSAVVVGPTAADAADDGNAPVQFGGIARTANPTAVAGNDVVKATFDDLGRQVMRPIQMRDLIKTAYASVTNITETTLLAATASAYNDLIFVKFSNQSSAAVNVALRSSTGGTIVDTFSVPANGTVGYAPKVPVPANELASSWTFKNTASDDSTTTITASGLFTTEI